MQSGALDDTKTAVYMHARGRAPGQKSQAGPCSPESIQGIGFQVNPF